MDSPFSKKDVILTSSNYACMVTQAERILKRLKHNVKLNVDGYSETMNNSELGAPKTLEKHMEWWINDVKDQLQALEFYGRKNTLRAFFYPSNYLHTLWPPVTTTAEKRHKIAVYNITFPEQKEPKLHPISPKFKIGSKRKCTLGKLTEKNNVCWMNMRD